jgi:hypothetical protein
MLLKICAWEKMTLKKRKYRLNRVARVAKWLKKKGKREMRMTTTIMRMEMLKSRVKTK